MDRSDRSTIKSGGRSTAIYLGNSKIRFMHPCAHTSMKDYSKGPVPKRVGALGCQLMVKMWSSSGVVADCARCSKK